MNVTGFRVSGFTLIAALFAVVVAMPSPAQASLSGTCAGMSYTVQYEGSDKARMTNHEWATIPLIAAGVRYTAAAPAGGSYTTYRWSSVISGHTYSSPSALGPRTGARGFQEHPNTGNSCYTSVSYS